MSDVFRVVIIGLSKADIYCHAPWWPEADIYTVMPPGGPMPPSFVLPPDGPRPTCAVLPSGGPRPPSSVLPPDGPRPTCALTALWWSKAYCLAPWWSEAPYSFWVEPDCTIRKWKPGGTAPTIMLLGAPPLYRTITKYPKKNSQQKINATCSTLA